MPSLKRVDMKEGGGSERLKGGRCDESCDREREKFIVRQPPILSAIGEKDDYHSENSWISDGLPSSSRSRRRGDGRWKGGEWREK